MGRMRDKELVACQRLIKDLLEVIERHDLAADGELGRQMEAHLRGALVALEAVDGGTAARD